MSLSVEQVRQMREQIKANDAAKTAAQKKTTTQTAKTTPAAPAAKSAGTGLSVAQVAQIRSQMTAAPASTSRLQTTASTSRLQTTASTPAWTGGTRQVLGTVSADTLGKQVLADMASNTGSPVATDRQEDYEPGWNYVGSDNAPKQRAIAQGTYGSYAKAAQKVGNALAKDRQTDRFDELNQWMDADPRPGGGGPAAAEGVHHSGGQGRCPGAGRAGNRYKAAVQPRRPFEDGVHGPGDQRGPGIHPGI